VIVVSDHGSGPVSNQAIYLNLWLAQQGLLQFCGDGQSKSGRSTLASSTIWAIRTLKSVYNKLIPSWRIQARFTKLFSGLRRRFEKQVFFADVDWSRTKAYSEEIRGSIWINLKGRDPAGIVEPGEGYESLRDRIVEQLSGLRDPETGEPVIRNVWRREDLYEGPFVDRFPDLLVEPFDTPMVFRARSYAREKKPIRVLSKDELAQSPVTGSHVMDGILILHGNAIQGGKHLPQCSILDVTPTVLYLMGLPVPSDMDGRVIEEAIQPSYLDTHPIEWTSGAAQLLFEEKKGDDYTEEESKDIEERLRGLGYL
jgi:predicted AlkP superfamily phosphohydrolase/phosphomutase